MQPDRPLVAIEAEHGVLGALMKCPELCETLGAFLGFDDFSSPDNQALYALILTCHSRKVIPDPLSLAEIRAQLPSGDATMAYAGELWTNVASVANAEHYARIVVERAQARRLHQAGQALMDLSMERGSISEQIAQAQQIALALSAQDDRPDVVTLGDAMLPLFDEMEARWKGEQAVGLKFNLPDLDRIAQGLRPGNLVIVAGRPGTGKTVLGVGLADEVAVRRGGAALVFSLEMTQAEIAKRSLAALASVPQAQIDSGQALNVETYCNNLQSAVAVVRKADLRICDRPALTLARLCSIARFQHRAGALDLIVIDYLSLIASEPGSKYQNRNQELGAVSRGLKALAKELGVPIVALAQLNRSIESRVNAKPKMSDLRDSGEIEQDADLIIMAHRDMQSDLGQSGITEIEIVKNRHAKPGFCLLQLQGEFARFVSCAQEREEQQAFSVRSFKTSARAMLGEA
jgi:replicative DNA helicase